jgi:hypothetical protein
MSLLYHKTSVRGILEGGKLKGLPLEGRLR